MLDTTGQITNSQADRIARGTCKAASQKQPLANTTDRE